MVEDQMIRIAISSSILVVILLIIKINLDLNRRFKERRARRTARRLADHQRVQENRYVAVAGGRATGRTATTFAGLAAQAVQQQVPQELWASTTSTTQNVFTNAQMHSHALSQGDMMQAYEVLRDQPLGPQQSQEVAIEQLREMVREQEQIKELEKEEKEFKSRIDEPFWAWNERTHK